MAKKSIVAPHSPYWLMKSEPDVFSFEMLTGKGERGEAWDGVRNYQARNNMRAMRVGDLGFFYHSNEGKEIVGVLQVVKPAHPDPKDETGTWQCVTVRAVCPLPVAVTLEAAKANPKLAKMPLVTSTRLSVQPVTLEHWTEICRMGGLEQHAIASALGAPLSKPQSAKRRRTSASTI